ncbi:MAG: hypothetical protein H0Z24_07020 [Thermosipho sp. (in: Bacteria)]|nr:hypothetical protein [Thermosipho sp. (in: thermotogales)]
MKKIILLLVLSVLVLTSCTQIPFSFNIPPTSQVTLNVDTYGGSLPVLFKDIVFDQLENVEVFDRVILDSLRIDLELQATGTILNAIDVSIYASTTEITLSDIDDSLKIATPTFTSTNKIVNVTLDSSTSPVLSQVIEYLNSGGRIFHIAVFVVNEASSLDEVGVRVIGGEIKGKFKIIQ